MSFGGTTLAILEDAFAMEEEPIHYLEQETSLSSTDMPSYQKYTSDHGSQTEMSFESVSERRYLRKARPMPHKEFSRTSVLLDTSYRHKSIDESDDAEKIESYTNQTEQDFVDKVERVGVGISTEDVKESKSSESQSCYGTENVVTYLRPEYIRWFYKSETDRSWVSFTGFDSSRIEAKFRARQRQLRWISKEGQGEGLGTHEAEQSTENLDRKFTLVNKNYFQQSREFSFKRKREKSGSKWFGCWLDDENENVNCLAYEKEDLKEEAKPEANTLTRKISEKRDDKLVYVRGGLYEVNVDTWTCTATYWAVDGSEITRGTWFYDGTWEPLPADQAQRLEEEHLDKYAGTPINTAISDLIEPQQPDSPTRTTRPVVHRVSFPDFHVDWASATEIHLYSKAASYQFVRSVGQRLGFQAWGHRLCRGYLKPAALSDRPSEISHIVFVVHGIGQKMDTGRIARNCATETVAHMRSRYFPQQLGSKQKAEFFPVEWRSIAKLDGDIVEAITPTKLLYLRQLLNATAMDIMYYTSPLYRIEIQCALKSELNRIYANFVKRNPNFEAHGGKVSILAHSLGAVITYDIVTGYTFDYPQPWPGPGSSVNALPESTDEINHEGIIVIDDICGENVATQPKGLPFKLEHFFCMGSPLSVFLALRWREPHNPDLRSHILPQKLCHRIYNLFHCADPVAYRIEPLLNQAYRGIDPMCINTYNALVQSKIEQIGKEASNCKEQYLFDKSGEIIISVTVSDPQQQTRLNAFGGPKSPPVNSKDIGRGWWNFIKNWKNPVVHSDDGQTQTEGNISNGSDSPSPVEEDIDSEPDITNTATLQPDPDKIKDDLDYRIDYVLKEGNLSNSYLSALTSHTSYWSSPEIAFFVLTNLHNGPLDLKPDKVV